MASEDAQLMLLLGGLLFDVPKLFRKRTNKRPLSTTRHYYLLGRVLQMSQREVDLGLCSDHDACQANCLARAFPCFTDGHHWQSAPLFDDLSFYYLSLLPQLPFLFSNWIHTLLWCFGSRIILPFLLGSRAVSCSVIYVRHRESSTHTVFPLSVGGNRMELHFCPNGLLSFYSTHAYSN